MNTRVFSTGGDDVRVLVFQSFWLQSGNQGGPLCAHALDFEVQTVQLGGLDTAPQGDGNIDADAVGKVPVAQLVGAVDLFMA